MTVFAYGASKLRCWHDLGMYYVDKHIVLPEDIRTVTACQLAGGVNGSHV